MLDTQDGAGEATFLLPLAQLGTSAWVPPSGVWYRTPFFASRLLSAFFATRILSTSGLPAVALGAVRSSVWPTQLVPAGSAQTSSNSWSVTVPLNPAGTVMLENCSPSGVVCTVVGPLPVAKPLPSSGVVDGFWTLVVCCASEPEVSSGELAKSVKVKSPAAWGARRSIVAITVVS